MTQYKYYFSSDSTKEAIGKVKAFTRKRAIKKAAARKRLSVEHFLELFNVEEV
tara:strand:- start:296 stop:454 length:159 start_codon:yes stop_codon:yes gene_type:complete